MTEVIHVDGVSAKKVVHSPMEALGYTELTHLESWITAEPSVLDDSLMVVTTQFDRWSSDAGDAHERPDVLALSNNGQLVVIELKRGSDRRVHLQAITYAALASAFTIDDLAVAHFEWLRKRGDTEVTAEIAKQLLEEHVDVWRESLLATPRIMLVAEDFPPQVVTTVQWLSDVAPDLVIECHEYTPFRDHGETYVAFNRIFPVEDLADRQLRPAPRDARADVVAQGESQRRARSARILAESRHIPDGAQIDLRPEGNVATAAVDAVNQWLDKDPARRDVSWINDATRPLRWTGSADPDQQWTPSGLRNRIFEDAGVAQHNFSANDAWSYQGKTLYEIAKSLTAGKD